LGDMAPLSKIVLGAGVFTASANKRSAMIEEIQNTPGVQWKAGSVEKFAKQELGVGLIPLMGVTPEAMADRAKYAEENKITNLKAMDIPESFDSETHWPQCAKVIDDIRDQSACGCCWAFAAASAASDRLCISTNATIVTSLSAEDICFCTAGIPNGCGGGSISAPWDHMKFGSWFLTKGAVTGGQYQGTGAMGAGLCSDFSLPHCHHHGPQGKDPFPAENTPGCPVVKMAPKCQTTCDSTAKAPHNDWKSDKIGFTGSVGSANGEDKIAQAIMQGGPVETAFTVYTDFENYVSGVYHHVSGKAAGGHAVRIVGWGSENGQKYWKVANSWNPFWGEKGYFRIAKGTNECDIEHQVTFSSPTAKWGKKSDLVQEEKAVVV